MGTPSAFYSHTFVKARVDFIKNHLNPNPPGILPSCSIPPTVRLSFPSLSPFGSERFSSFNLLIAVFALQFHSVSSFPLGWPTTMVTLHHRLSDNKDWVLRTLPSSEALPEDVQKMLPPFFFKSVLQGWDFPRNFQSMCFISLVQHLNSVPNSHSFHIQMSYLANE